MKKEKKGIYFPGLNALRFIAATLVIFHHIEQYKYWAGLPNNWGNTFVGILGHKPVAFFFVLSGYLITYLLLQEYKQHKSIDIPKFYFRRFLRIWPLYFAIVGVALFVMPLISGISFGQLPNPTESPIVLIFLFLFIPNVLRISFPALIGGNQLWSVGIEEQFYLIWPWLIRMFIKNIVPFLLVFIGIKMTIHLFLIIAFDFTSYDWLMSIEKLYGLFPVEQMAFGGLGASILFDHKKKLLGIIRHPFTGVLALSSLILLCALDMKIFFHTYLEAVLFLIIIMQVVHHERIYKHLENKWLSHLGKISYGIYMWHTVVIALLLTTIEFTGFSFIDPHYILLVLSPVITIVVAHYSYVFMERPIMSLKLRLNLKKASRGFHVTRP